MGCNEADVVRSARPKGKKCQEIFMHIFFMKYLSGYIPDIAM